MCVHIFVDAYFSPSILIRFASKKLWTRTKCTRHTVSSSLEERRGKCMIQTTIARQVAVSWGSQIYCVCRRDRSVETISLSGQSRGNNNNDGLFARIKKKGDRRRSKGGRTEETTKDSKWNAFSENLGSMVSRRLLYFMRFTDICQFREKIRQREREMNKEIDVEDRIQSLFHELCKLHDTK